MSLAVAPETRDLLTEIPVALKWQTFTQMYPHVMIRTQEVEFGGGWRINPDATPYDTCRVVFLPATGLVHVNYRDQWAVIGCGQPHQGFRIGSMLNGWTKMSAQHKPVLWVWKKLNRFYKDRSSLACSFARRYGFRVNKKTGWVQDRWGRDQWSSYDILGRVLVKQQLAEQLPDGRIVGYVPRLEAMAFDAKEAKATGNYR